MDEPPLAFWLESLSVRLFGFSTWALLLPHALAGVAAVGVVYRAVDLAMGKVAALAAALVMALTPVAVATAHSNSLPSRYPDGRSSESEYVWKSPGYVHVEIPRHAL